MKHIMLHRGYHRNGRRDYCWVSKVTGEVAELWEIRKLIRIAKEAKELCPIYGEQI